MSSTETLKKLASITDVGLFERLATAVLRESNSLYEPLVHTGVNSDGKTIKGPVDGVVFVRGANEPHMISVHHTTGDRDKLRKKLLHDPSAVKSKKTITSKPMAGDILKTIEIYNEERKRTSNLTGTLVLTFSSDPSQDVVRDAEAKVREVGIEIDLWPASRIAHFLDTDPNGQYIRGRYLGINEERLSRKLLSSLSQKSLDQFSMVSDPETWIHRDVDLEFRNISKYGVTIISGESGKGKTVACYKYLSMNIEKGGYSLVLPHKFISQSYSLDQAINNYLRSLFPTLLNGAGADALSITSAENPILILIEDINKSGEAVTLLEKVALWGKQNSEESSQPSYCVLCPVWPKVLSSLNQELKKSIEDSIFLFSGYSDIEGMLAVKARHSIEEKVITELKAQEISSSLGNDPLLIALCDVSRDVVASEIIKDFVENKLTQLSLNKEEYSPSEYYKTILKFMFAVMAERIANPVVSDIEKLNLSSGEVEMLKHVANQGDVFKFIGNIDSESIVFRHDRVSDWLMAKSISQKLLIDSISDELLSEPYYSRVVGLSLIEEDFSFEVVNRVKATNPLALFYALMYFTSPKTDSQNTIISLIFKWLDESETHEKSREYLRWECLNVLSLTDSQYVLEILTKFEDKTWSYYEAGFRNGGLAYGAELCRRLSPGIKAQSNEKLIEYVLSKYDGKIITPIKALLKKEGLSCKHRSGLLRLCGYIADSSLYGAIQYAWNNESELGRKEILDDYLWAGAHCCGNNAKSLLEPIMDVWASFSDERKDVGDSSERDDFAAHEVKWAFERYVPNNAVDYFITQIDRKELEGPMFYMLHKIDHPKIVSAIVKYLADEDYKAQQSGIPSYSFMYINHPASVYKKNGISMCDESRERLFRLWSDIKNNEFLRRNSFSLWSAGGSDDDLTVLQYFEDDQILRDGVLKERIKRKDHTVFPLLEKKINNDARWWYSLNGFWSDNLTSLLDSKLGELKVSGDGTLSPGVDHYILSGLITRLPNSVAESLLLKNWGCLKSDRRYIQAALYVASEKLEKLVRLALQDVSDPTIYFEHISMRFGVNMFGHQGITNIRQLEVLLPYLKYLKERDLYSLSRVCNENCWYDFRKNNLDPMLVDSDCKLYYLSEDKIFKSLNEMIVNGSTNFLDYWADDLLKAGKSKKSIINILFEWIKQHDDVGLSEIELSLKIIHIIGDRSSYEDFLSISEDSYELYYETFDNYYYALRRRRLH